MGLTLVLDRETGEPLFPTPELPVPPSNIPGEQAWPTQPFPLRPPPLNRLAVHESDLTRVSPVAHGAMLYQLACAGCHKSDRKGALPLVRNLLISEKTDEEMEIGIRNGQGLMPALSQFSDRELDALVAFIRSPADTEVEIDPATSLEQQLMAEDRDGLVRAAVEQGDASR